MGLALLVTHVLLPGHQEAFDALVDRTLEAIRELEPGTLVYVSHGVEGDPLRRVFYELYRSRAAFHEHEAQEHVQAFLAERQQHVTSVDVTVLDAVSGTLGPAGL